MEKEANRLDCFSNVFHTGVIAGSHSIQDPRWTQKTIHLKKRQVRSRQLAVKEPRRIFGSCVFAGYSRNKCRKTCFFLQKLCYLYRYSSICVPAVGNTAHGKFHTWYPPKRNFYAHRRYVGRKLTFTAIVMGRRPNQADAFLNPNSAPVQKTLRHLLVNLKNVRLLTPPMSFNIDLRRQCQPLAYRTVHASL